jgi:hypothetical protein
MSSSESTVSSRPNSFIKARSFALLIFMRSGLTFSVGRRGDRGFVARQVFFDVRQVDVALGRVLVSLGLAAALGAGGGRCCSCSGGLGRAADFLGGRSGCFFGIVERGRFRGHGFHFRCGCRFGRGGTRLSCRLSAGFQRFFCCGLGGDAFGK